MLSRFPRRVPRLPRSLARSLATLEQSDVDHFRTLLPSSSVLSTFPPHELPSSDLDGYNTDWMGKYIGGSRCVLKPKTTEQVSKIVQHCAERGLGIVPQGGNTGLVGGGVPTGKDEVLINLALMNNIRSFEPSSGVLIADAGCVLETLNTYLGEQGHTMPLDLGAKGSCQIGGNVSTNAGGLRMLRYGSLHANVLGLEVVLPDGRVVNGLRGLRKDNTGYHIHHLFVGAEGTLGIVTGVALLTPALSPSVNLAILRLPNYDSVLHVFREVRSRLGEILSAVEYMGKDAWTVTVGHQGNDIEQQVFGEDPPDGVNLIIETSGSNSEHDEEKLSSLLEDLLSSPHVLTGALAQDTTQLHNMWQIREGVAEACGRAGKVYKYDVSVPIQEWENVLGALRERAETKGKGLIERVVGFGHIGDGNLHINVICPKYTKETEAVLEPFMFELVASKKGSISAEHGIGVQKAKFIHYSKTPLEIELMRTFKNSIDPQGIMNPGKVVLPEGAGAQ